MVPVNDELTVERRFQCRGAGIPRRYVVLRDILGLRRHVIVVLVL